MPDGDKSMAGNEQANPSIVVLKCLECKRPALFRLRICHVANGVEYRAKSCCRGCVSDNSLNDLRYRDLAPKLVDNQQIDLGCHEANGSLDGCIGREERDA